MSEKSAERLRAIARRIRLLPEHPAYKGRLPGKLCRRASVLFDEALKLGAFSGPEHEVMREAVEGTQSLHPKGWQKEVWLVAVLYLCPRLREQLSPVGSIEPACGPIAELIEAEAARLSLGGTTRKDERQGRDRTGSAITTNPVNLDALDERLSGLLGLLTDETRLPNAAAAVRQFVQDHTSDVFGPRSLFRPEWEETWGLPNGGFANSWILAADGLDDREVAALTNVCVKSVRFLKSDTDYHRDKHAGQLREAVQEYLALRGYDVSAGGARKSHRRRPTAKRVSTEKGEAQAKIVAALTLHHSYQSGSCLHLEPVGVRELAQKAGVAPGSVTNFFNKQFGGPEESDGHSKYKVVCRDPSRLAESLKVLNGEFSPHLLYGRKPPGEDDRGDED